MSNKNIRRVLIEARTSREPTGENLQESLENYDAIILRKVTEDFHNKLLRMNFGRDTMAAIREALYDLYDGGRNVRGGQIGMLPHTEVSKPVRQSDLGAASDFISNCHVTVIAIPVQDGDEVGVSLTIQFNWDHTELPHGNGRRLPGKPKMHSMRYYAFSDDGSETTFKF